ncbi:TonB family protein [Bryobacter aggregatus]|uniref:TonB family protein n=1 Tax=Bryobacter aggregatus TaxID=360054 RepID=UPI0004E12944
MRGYLVGMFLASLLGSAQSPGVVKVLSSSAPRYPLAAYSAGTTGVVRVQVDLDQGGRVKAATVLDGPHQLRKASEKAALLWQFEPTATPQPRSIQLSFRFFIQDPPQGILSVFRFPYEVEIFGEEEATVILADPPINIGRPKETKPKPMLKK